jgi:hypothetical protein
LLVAGAALALPPPPVAALAAARRLHFVPIAGGPIICDYDGSHRTPLWRNWQTRMVQVHVLAREWGFNSLQRQFFDCGFRISDCGLEWADE